MGLFATINLHPSFNIKPLILDNIKKDTFLSKLNPSALQLGFRFQV